MFQSIKPLFMREFLGYFRTPIGYVFIIVFLLASLGCMFFLGGFFESNQASMQVYFNYHPWLFLFLVPAVGMRLWAEERREGTDELLFTLPITQTQAITAKFLAGWLFIVVALALSFPLIITVNFLGEPDNGVIFTGYIGSMLMAGAYLAISCFTSAISKNQVIAFILGVIICFIMVLIGWGVFTNLLAGIFSAGVIDFIASIGFISHYSAISRGLMDSRDIVYFISIITAFLTLNGLVLSGRRIA
ncbi:MAG: ABC transporter permease [Oligoflexales bacterium]|nr:ABC transporter permease [Oligoflexales bacterium]